MKENHILMTRKDNKIYKYDNNDKIPTTTIKINKNVLYKNYTQLMLKIDYTHFKYMYNYL